MMEREGVSRCLSCWSEIEESYLQPEIIVYLRHASIHDHGARLEVHHNPEICPYNSYTISVSTNEGRQLLVECHVFFV